MTETVVTRFAPSPTGFLHIGGARTALFNWLYARGRGGKMLLRIEDTDRERSTEAAIDAILDGLTWLGIDWDGEAVYQFSRADAPPRGRRAAAGRRHAPIAATPAPEELDRDAREGARAKAAPSSTTAAGATAIPSEAPPGVKPVIRLKAPLTGETVIEDQVQGRVAWQNENLDDLVLLRSDGTPTYMLAVVVDDHDMGVTHIIRGDDHLTNARPPEADLRGARLDGAGDGAYPADPRAGRRRSCPSATARSASMPIARWAICRPRMRNYLVRLGWSHGDQEIFSTEEMIAAFDLPQIGRSPARFDFAKLESLNGHYIRQTADADLLAALERLLPHIAGGERACRQADAGAAEQAARRHAGPEGARQDPGRADRRRAASSSPTGRSRSTTRPPRC